MNRKERIRELETELRILEASLYCKAGLSAGLHARHNRQLKRYDELRKELRELKEAERKDGSVLGRIKKILGERKSEV